MYFEDFRTDMKWEIGEEKITREEMLDYARKYDAAPVHADEEYGRECRFGDIIAPGTLTLMKMMKRWQDEHGVQKNGFVMCTASRNQWMVPVMDGDAIHAVLRITELEETDAEHGFVRMVINVFNQDNSPVMTTDFEHLYLKREAGNREVV